MEVRDVENQRPAGLEDPPGLAQDVNGRLRIEVGQCPSANHRVEPGILERQGPRGQKPQARVAEPATAPPGQPEGAPGYVDPLDPSAAWGQRGGQGAVAAPDVQHGPAAHEGGEAGRHGTAFGDARLHRPGLAGPIVGGV